MASGFGVSRQSRSFVDVLQLRAEKSGALTAFRFPETTGGGVAVCSYSELDLRARCIARMLEQYARPGDRAILSLPSGIDYISAFFGCLYAGVIAVPCGEIRTRSSLKRWAPTLIDSDPALVLTTSRSTLPSKGLAEAVPGFTKMQVLAVDDIPRAEGRSWQERKPNIDDTAFLQYTSGSTSAPRGVMISHANLLHNSECMRIMFGYSCESECVTWLPPFHDMGLIGGLLQPIYGGFPCTVLSPSSFVQSPLSWLEAISEYRATISGGPNFAFELCVRHAHDQTSKPLDLSSWRTAFVGAEPVRRGVLEAFFKAFEGSSIRRDAFRPCFGLAESTLLVTCGSSEDTDIDGRVCCGVPAPGLQVRIVDPASEQLCAKDCVGEILVAGPSVSSGYWQKRNDQQCVCDGHLRTGDLGFLHNGKLYVTGRLSELIIIRGTNYYPQDIETTIAESVPELSRLRIAAFSTEVQSQERLIVVAEWSPSSDGDRLFDSITEAVVSTHQVELYRIVLVRSGAIPHTSSGKTQRRLCREMLSRSELPVLAERTLDDFPALDSVEDLRDLLKGLARTARLQKIVEALQGAVARLTRNDGQIVRVERPLVEFGLDSLQATELSHWVQESFGLDVRAASVLGGASIKDLAEDIAETYEAKITGDCELSMEENSLSPNEASLWFLHRLYPESSRYNLSGAVKFKQHLNANAMRRALDQLAIRHEALRTTFPDVDGTPQRAIHTEPFLDFHHELEPGDLSVRLSKESSRSFDLASGPLWRVLLLLRPNGESILVVVVHHIIFDFSSLAIFLKELGLLYSAEISSDAARLPLLELSLTEHARFKQDILKKDGERLAAHWTSHLAGVTNQLISSAHYSNTSPGENSGLQHLVVSRITSDRIKRLAREHATTPAVVLASVFQLLLHRWTGKDDFVLGFPFSGRNKRGSSGIIGYLVNMTAVRSRYRPFGPFHEFLIATRKAIADAHEHQDYPIARLVEELKVRRNSQDDPLIQATFVYQNASSMALPVALGLPERPVPFGAESASSVAIKPAMQFEISLIMGDSEQGFEGILQYDEIFLDAQTAGWMLNAFDCLLDQITENPAAVVADLPLLRGEQRNVMLSLGRPLGAPFPNDSHVVFKTDPEWDVPGTATLCRHPLAGRFSQQALLTPNALAVSTSDGEISFLELEERSNQLAHHLLRYGVGPGIRVALSSGRTIQTIVGVIGIWKTGAAYVPIPLTDPEERAEFVLRDAGAGVYIQTATGPILRGIPLITLHDFSLLDSEPRTCPLVDVDREEAAYVIYTSGSTGRPKGVIIPNRAVLGFHRALREAVYQALGDRPLKVTLNAPLSFDASVQQVIQLLSGHTLVIVPDEVRRDAGELAVFLAKNAIDVLDCTPVQLQALLESPGTKAISAQLKAVLVGGEAISVGLWKTAAQLSSTRLFNVYGPTECTVDATIQPIHSGSQPMIGRPLQNATTYVLDSRFSPVPFGVYGELYIGGGGVATGYLNQAGATAERFLPDAWTSQSGQRMYRTGDIVRWSSAGDLEYFGRSDRQAKIRGFRIELGEIEEKLRSLDSVSDAAVEVRGDDTNKRLVAYVKPNPGYKHDIALLRRELRGLLPEYMLPAQWMLLERLPQTPNGKLDRRCLPEPPDEVRPASGRLPATLTEERIAGIWRDLLKRESVGHEDDFFELGGHSLLATQMLSRIRDSFGFEVPLRQIFTTPRLGNLAETLDRLAEQQATKPHLIFQDRSGRARASYAQERMWILWGLAGGQSAAYHMSGGLRFKGELDVETLEWSINQVIHRHETLRTRFEMSHGTLWQVVEPTWHISLSEEDFLNATESEWRQAALEETGRPFDLHQLPVLRLRLFHIGAREWLLLLVFHHIAGDGWSFGVFEHEITHLYAARRDRRSVELPKLAIQYSDYAESQRSLVESGALEEHITWWRRRLSGPSEPLNLPRKSSPSRGDRANEIKVNFGLEYSERLRQFSRTSAATLHMILSASLAAVLSRYTGRSEIRLGIPVAGRSHRETEVLIGLFVNTIVAPVRVSAEETFAQMVQRLKGEFLASYERQDVPLQKLVEETRMAGNNSSDPFSLLFGLQNVPRPGLKIDGLTVETYLLPSLRTKTEISILLEDGASGLHGVLEYRANEYDQASMQRLLNHWQHWLSTAIAIPEQSIAKLPLMNADEQAWICETANGSNRRWTEASLVERFERQVQLTPDAVAVEGSLKPFRLTYSELNAQANQVARWLRKNGLRSEDRVGLFLRRGPWLIPALIGVLKAGGVYVPLDERYPPHRIRTILRDSCAGLLLTEAGLGEALSSQGLDVAILDYCGEQIKDQSVDDLCITLDPSNLAYILYTSGSTGQPKGVMLTHGGAINLVGWALESYSPEELASVTFSTSLGFDLSVYEIWAPLSCGGRLLILENVLAISDEPITLLNTVPSAIRELLSMQVLPTSLSVVNLAGEALTGDRVCDIYSSTKARRVVNLYGPTETTTYSTAFDADLSITEGPVSIGRPLINTQVYVLDVFGELTPIGVEGELFIGGAGVARGYLNRPDLTAERFLPCQFSRCEGDRFYRTGDRVRWSAHGNLEYIGRVDQQVKVRGFRIELGEIEAALRALPGIKDAVVVVRESKHRDKRLIGYVAVEPGRNGDLQRELRQALPDYMVPTTFIQVSDLPLTHNGKLDRNGLPAPVLEEITEIDAPQNAVEKILCSIWADVLGLDRVGIHQNFFELGGHSLLATQVIAKVRQIFQTEIPLRFLFESPSVASLAQRLAESEATLTEFPLVPVKRDGEPPLSFAQQRLWFLDRMEPGSAAYNLPLALRLKGALNVQAVQASLDEIARRHETLRTCFPTRRGVPVQQIAPAKGLPIALTDLRSFAGTEQERELTSRSQAEARQPFNLSHGPLVRARLLRLADQEQVLMLTMHHIVGDGWSIGVLIREFAECYRAYSSGGQPDLPELPIQYADFAVWQREFLQGEPIEDQLSYWSQQLRDLPALQLRGDRARPAVQRNRGGTAGFKVESSLTEQLKLLARHENVTLFILLQAAFKVLLARYSDQTDFAVGSPVANRKQSETEGLIGFFVNTIVLRSDLSGNPAFRHLITRERNTVLDAYAHQDVPFERVLETLAPERDLSRTSLFQVMFSLQNTSWSALELPALDVVTLEPELPVAKFDLTVTLSEDGSGGLSGNWQYNADLFELDTAKQQTRHFIELLRSAVEQPDTRIEQLCILGPEERQRICRDWNQTERAFPLQPNLAALFEQQVSRTPEAIAVEYRNQRLTYRELDQRANAIAFALRARGVREDSLVGIFMERGPEMIVAILGVIKAGGATVPLDKSYPEQRLRFMVADAAIEVLLTEIRSNGLVPNLTRETLYIDEILGRRAKDIWPLSGSPESLAYVMYTSGSTGQPKGIMVSHQAVKRLVLESDYVDIRPGDRIAQAANTSFDAATFEIWGALLNGACIVGLTKADVLNTGSLESTLEEKRITHLFLTTALFNLHVRAAKDAFRTVRHLLFGGESVNVECVREVVSGSGPERLVHVYGPTECTTFSCWHLVKQVDADAQTVPIGRAIANTQAYVFDNHGELAPPGAQGELYIGGPGVARGYLKRPDITAEHFVPDPFSEQTGARLYKTGDRVRWSTKGYLEFLGRIDEQVKIRGFRIELSEIENCIRSTDGVAEAVVVTRGQGNEKRLIAYVSPQPRHMLDAAQLSRTLRQQLPDYMVPGQWMILDRVPQSPNGKLDRKQLPEPVEQPREARGRKPETPTEENIAEIWRELLKRDSLFADDNFFELGGHSLLATQVAARIRESFGVELPLRQIFEHPRLADLAGAIDDLLIEAAIHSGDHALVRELQNKIALLSPSEVEALTSQAREERNYDLR